VIKRKVFLRRDHEEKKKKGRSELRSRRKAEVKMWTKKNCGLNVLHRGDLIGEKRSMERSQNRQNDRAF